MGKLTESQLLALVDLRDGKRRYGISIRGRRALPSLVKRGLVFQHYGHMSADQWEISPKGKEAVLGRATVAHLRDA